MVAVRKQRSVSRAPTAFSFPSSPRFLGGWQRPVALFDGDRARVGHLTSTGAAFDVLTWPIRDFTWFLKRHFCSPCSCESSLEWPRPRFPKTGGPWSPPVFEWLAGGRQQLT